MSQRLDALLELGDASIRKLIRSIRKTAYQVGYQDAAAELAPGPTHAKGLRGFAGMSTERRREACSKGGKAAAQKPGFLSEIGTKGGNALMEKYGSEHMSEMGFKGGLACGAVKARPGKRKPNKPTAASVTAENNKAVKRRERLEREL